MTTAAPLLFLRTTCTCAKAVWLKLLEKLAMRLHMVSLSMVVAYP